MKIILTEKINKLGNIGDSVEVKTGYARNCLFPNGKAMRWSKENIALFESKKAELQAAYDAAKKNAESQVDSVKNAKFYMIRQAGDTGNLYGSVSSRDIARMLKDITNININSAQVLLGSPIKSVGSFDTKITLHADVIVPVKVYVAQTAEEIDALVAGKKLTFGTKKVEEEIFEEDFDDFESGKEELKAEKEVEIESDIKPKKSGKSKKEEIKAEKVEADAE